MTGIASRYVGFYIAGLLIILGIFPAIGQIFQSIPKPVLGAATTIMFGTIAANGIRILGLQKITKKSGLTIAISLSVGLSVILVPNLLDKMPEIIKNVLGSSITLSGLTAIACSLIIPETE